MGNCAFDVISAILAAIGHAFKAAVKAIGKGATVFYKTRLRQPLYDIWCAILTPFAHAWGYLATTKIKFVKSFKRGFRPSVKGFFIALYRLISGTIHALKYIFCYVAPVVCIAFLISLIKYAGTLQYAVSVSYNGNDLGVIENQATFNQAQTLVQDKVTYTEQDNAILAKPTFSVQYATNDDNQMNADSLSEHIINTSGEKIVEAYGFYINGSLMGVYNEEEMLKIKAALEAKLAEYFSKDVATVDFEDNVEISQGRYIESNITTADEMLEYINGTTKVQAYYVIQKGDSVGKIASNLGYARDDLIAENPFLKNGAKTGEVVTYHYQEPNLSILTTHLENYDRVVERTVQYIYDDRSEEYCEVLRQMGSDGLENVTAIVTERNGKESDRAIVSSYTIEEMNPRIFAVGTKENEFFKENKTTIIDKIGSMVWPVGGKDGGYVSSLYGWRNWDKSYHKGLDIAAKRGTDLYAAADGVVTYASTKGSFGKLVIIDHGHGIETYYAHQYAIDVKVGDVVKKGDVIGHVGMTGSASGNHLHFEVRYYNDRIDPFMGLGGEGRHDINE